MGKIGTLLTLGAVGAAAYVGYRVYKGIPDVGGFIGGITDFLGGIGGFLGGLFDGGGGDGVAGVNGDEDAGFTGLVDPTAGATAVLGLPGMEAAYVSDPTVMAHLLGGFTPTISPIEAVVARAEISGLSPIDQAIFEAEARRVEITMRGR